MDDNTATATKTLLQSIPISSADLYTWKEYIIPLPETDDDYFAFSVTTSTPSGNWHYTYGYLDDIYYEDLWPCFFPMNIEVSDITMTEATISWDASLDPGATEYEYEIRTSGAPGSGATGLVDSDTTTDTEADITGLTAATNYTVYVRSICGTSTGEWTIYPTDFMTACPVFGDFRSEERRVGKECRCWGVGENSSRRRHTRCGRDWSSDVCSSDLGFGCYRIGR